MALRGVFFDVFGTLLPYRVMPREIILSKRAGLVGLTISVEDMKSALERLTGEGRGFAMAGQMGHEDVPRDRRYWEQQFGNVLVAAGVQGDIAALATGMCDTFLQTEDYYLDEETLPTLRGLKQLGFMVGAISNAPKGLSKTLEKYGVLPELAVAVGSQDIGIEKPDPRIFHYALRETGLRPEQAAYVGDEYMTDAMAAQAVGMLGIFLDRNGAKETSDLPRIRRLSDLLAPGSPVRV